MINIACLHAHYSNIAYIERAFYSHTVQLQHYVDPGVMWHVQHHQIEQAKMQVGKQLQWIATTKPDVLVVTCTNYIALMDASLSVPMIEIDVPFFKLLKQQKLPLTLFFTNPQTVEGTLKRLYTYVTREVEVVVIPKAFDLLMAGDKVAHDKIVVAALQDAPKNAAVAQLSMVDAAEKIGLLHPLMPLVEAILNNE